MKRRLVAVALCSLGLVHGAGCGADTGGDAGSGGAATSGSAGGGCDDGSVGAGLIAPTCGPCAPCEQGMSCKAGSDCASGSCVDGVCCASACEGSCVACSKAKTGAADGTCASVKSGTDPDAECEASPAATCGASGEGCNGDAALPGCRLHASGTECAPPTCIDGVALVASRCDGEGTCDAALPQPCTPTICDPVGPWCLASCASSADCMATHWCEEGACVARAAQGTSCSSEDECATGHCADGVCCDSACDGGCEACAMTAGALSDGSCTVLPKGAPGAPSCAPYVCAGNFGTCPIFCQSSGDCASPAVCVGSSCVVPKANGASCKTSLECTSGNCIDGTCCNSSCGGACMACDVKGALGTCAFVPALTDPDAECVGHCNGAGACAGPTYAADLQPLFESKCGPCHTTFKSGGTNFAAVYSDSLLTSLTCAGLDVAACTVVRLQNGSMPKNKGCTGNPNLDAANLDCFTEVNYAELAAWLSAGRPK